MKTQLYLLYKWKEGYALTKGVLEYFKIILIRSLCCIMLLLLYQSSISKAQDIIIKNPSLEIDKITDKISPYWYVCGRTPDVHPSNCCGSTQKASEGKNYIGALSGNIWKEGIGQKLSSTLKANKTYTLSFDLAYPPYYIDSIAYGSLVVYGENTPEGQNEILWESGPFIHTEWKRYTITFKPMRDYDYISFWPDCNKCKKKEYSAVLIDNFSPTIREVPQIELVTRNACKGTNNGSALVKVKGGQPPYYYNWNPGNNTTEEASNLRTGTYEVTVTGANGATTKGEVIIDETEVQVETVVSPPTCYGFNNASIKVLAAGGSPPYSYDLNNGAIIQDQPGFMDLKNGTYNLKVTDTRGCSVTLNYLTINQPSSLQISAVHRQDVSCSETKDGKIALDMKGGTAPYSFSLDYVSWQTDSIWKHLDAGIYYFKVKDNNDCHITGQTEIIKNWRNCAVFVPTAFSPNGDGLNDVFKARIQDEIFDFRLIVYNRWGQPVFQTTDPAQGWDGGQQASGGYLWVLTYTDNKKQARKQQGSLILIK